MHAMTREGIPGIADVSGSAEGLVAGSRRSIALKLDAKSRPGVFAVRKQWPSDGTWLVRINLANTTALVSLDDRGNVSGVRIPATMAEGRPIPRVVVAPDLDSTPMRASAH